MRFCQPILNLLLCSSILISSTVLATTSKQYPFSEDSASCQPCITTLADVGSREAIRTTTIYTWGATVGMASVCQLAANRLQEPTYLPPTRCVAIGLGVGIVTAAAHTRVTYTDEVWNWIGKRIAASWKTEGLDLKK